MYQSRYEEKQQQIINLKELYLGTEECVGLY